MAQLTQWRIGITQRRVPANATAHARDALDAEWSDWFRREFAQDHFLAIPNFAAPEDAVSFAHQWEINALILSGGEDVGSSPQRDQVEYALLDAARNLGWPILGVCRGMQLLHLQGGGSLVAMPSHTGAAHSIEHDRGVCMVNSSHRWAIREVLLDWHVLAQSSDGTIEAARHRHRPWLGLMWHPERSDNGGDVWRRWLRALFERRSDTVIT